VVNERFPGRDPAPVRHWMTTSNGMSNRSWLPSSRNAVDVSPSVGLDGQGICVSTMNFIALGSWNFVD
jgi:hypothetical protein